jgi:hypothetical protein
MEEIKVRAAYQDDVSPGIKKTSQNVKTEVDGINQVLSSLGKAAVGFFAFDKIKDAIVGSVKAAAEAADAQSRLALVIKNTNGAAGITQVGLNSLAEQMQKNTRVSDDSVIKIGTQLATLDGMTSNLSESIIKVAADWAGSTNTFEEKAQALTMAMANPTMAMKQMRSQGIFFTDEQAKMIKALDDSGDAASAFAIVLGKVSEQTKGGAAEAAKTASGQWTMLGNKWGDIAKQLGNGLMPTIQLLGQLLSELTIVVENFGKIVVGVFQSIFGIISTMTSAFTTIVGEFIDSLVELTERLLDVAALLPNKGIKEWAANSKKGLDEFKTSIDNTAQSWYELANISFYKANANLAAGMGFRAPEKPLVGPTISDEELNARREADRIAEIKKAAEEATLKGQLLLRRKAAEEAQKISDAEFEKWQKDSEETAKVIEEDNQKEIDALDKKIAIINKLEDDAAAKKKKHIEDVANYKQTMQEIEIASISNIFEKQRTIIENQKEKDLKDLENAHTNKLISDEEYEKTKLEIQKIYAEQSKQIIADQIANQVNLYGGMAMQLTDIFSGIAQIEANNRKQRNDAAKEEIENSNMSAKQKEKALKELSKKQKDEERKAFEEGKSISYAQTVISGAMAIADVWSKWAAVPPVAIALTALSAALTATQLGIIASQHYALGGDFITNGRQTITVGDNPGGRERVQITPLSSPNVNGPQQAANIDMSIIVYGNVDADAANSINQRREEQLIQFKSMYRELQYTGQLV